MNKPNTLPDITFDKLPPQAQYLVFVRLNMGKSGALKKDSVVSYLRERQFPVDTTDQTYRVINTWEKWGIIDSSRESNKKWRKFSALELVWIRIATKLRWFGFSTRQIEVVKQALFCSPDAKPWFTLDFAVWQTINKGKFIKLQVFPDGKAYLREDDELIFEEHDFKGDFIHLNFSDIVKEVFQKPEIRINYDLVKAISPSEAEALSLIRKGDYSKVEVILKDGKIERLEASGKAEIDPAKLRLIDDVIKDGEFEEINIQRTNGNIVSINRTVKRKV